MTPDNINFPDRARHEREQDMKKIGENIDLFCLASISGFMNMGRGVLAVDITTGQTVLGRPFSYFPQELIDQGDDEEMKRMVSEYDPKKEFVVVLLKSDHRISTYRVNPKQPET